MRRALHPTCGHRRVGEVERAPHARFPIQRPLRTNRHVVALLSALWPGLGQLAIGARRSGLVLAVPPLIVVALAIGALASPDRLQRLAILLDPNVIAVILLFEAILVLWRLVAVADAFRRGRGRPRDRGAVLTAIALVFVLVPSAYAAYLTNVAREAATKVFLSTDKPYEPAAVEPGSTDPDFGALPGDSLEPLPSETAPQLGRFTVLLLGVDSGPSRGEALTDTMIVASLDPVAGAVSMISVPRDMVDVPLPDDRTFRPKINSLVSYVDQNPSKFKGATSGEAVLASALGKLLNVHIDGWAEVNLPGFVKVIDALGGVDVTVREDLCDPHYSGFDGFAISRGNYHLDGWHALAYARIRESVGENDFTRAARQGEVVVAARDRVAHGGFLNDPAGFIEGMSDLVSTSLDAATISKYIQFATIPRDHIYRTVITYPLVHGAADDPRGSVLIPRFGLIHDLAARAFPPPGTLPTGMDTIPENDDGKFKTKLPAVSCSEAPTPKPTPRPTPKPAQTPPPPPPTEQPTPEPPPAS
jgi:polyisoprenyl-teichoic acid--peptidoglycan teichoic acid transferase